MNSFSIYIVPDFTNDLFKKKFYSGVGLTVTENIYSKNLKVGR